MMMPGRVSQTVGEWLARAVCLPWRRRWRGLV
jgi:hypothetical protein